MKHARFRAGGRRITRRWRRHLCLGTLGAVLGAGAVHAHDFWIQPTPWTAAPNDKVGLSLLVGHGPDRQRSPISPKRIVRFQAIAPNSGRFDLRPLLQDVRATGDAIVSFSASGAYVLVLETDNRAESHVPARRFNDYLNTEGLTPALRIRARANRNDAEGAENYSRHAKAILQIGAYDPKGQAAVTRPLGLSLEIVPERSPLGLTNGGDLPIRVYYYGKPLGGALVKLNDLDRDAQPVEMHRTDSNGRASFKIRGKGSWQLNVIWTRPQPATELTDFDTSFSSLAFGTGT